MINSAVWSVRQAQCIMLSLVIGLAGCSSNAIAPVINKTPHRLIPPERVVQPADSIYTISWQYGLNFLDIAKWNGLKPPYDLKSGQRLGLRPISILIVWILVAGRISPSATTTTAAAAAAKA